jgi:hypothetical protein
MHLYMDDIVQTSTKIFKFNSTNSIKKQNWNCYKAAAVLVNNHDAESSLTAAWVENSLYLETALSR